MFLRVSLNEVGVEELKKVFGRDGVQNLMNMLDVIMRSDVFMGITDEIG
jgi:hypothetical protein